MRKGVELFRKSRSDPRHRRNMSVQCAQLRPPRTYFGSECDRKCYRYARLSRTSARYSHSRSADRPAYGVAEPDSRRAGYRRSRARCCSNRRETRIFARCRPLNIQYLRSHGIRPRFGDAPRRQSSGADALCPGRFTTIDPIDRDLTPPWKLRRRLGPSREVRERQAPDNPAVSVLGPVPAGARTIAERCAAQRQSELR